MKTRAPKTPAVQAKKDKAFFGKEGKAAFFGEQASKESFFGGETGGAGSAGAVQCKLTVGQPNDIYEKEADATADKIVQRLTQPGKEKTPVTPKAGLLQKKPIFESEGDPKEEPVQRKEAGSGAPAATPAVESGIRSSKGGGSALPSGTRQQMESGLGADLSGVRVHDDSGARKMSKDLNAQAFTHGKDIYFNSGKYDTQSTAGKRLLAHELTHVVQQNKGLSRKPDISLKEMGAHATGGPAGKAAGSGATSTVPASEGISAEADRTMVRRVPMVQKNGTSGGGAGDPNNPGGDDKDITKMDQAAIDSLGKHPAEGYITKTGADPQKAVISIHFDQLPFKQYAGPFTTIDKQGNEYVAKPPFRKPTSKRKTRQGPVWKKEALGPVTESLKGIVDTKKLKGQEFNLTVRKQKKLGVSGTVDQIANQIVVPFWDDKGNPMKHQVEHKVDWQVAGFNDLVDVISNLLLLEARENMRIGQVVLDNMEKFYKAIINDYKKKGVTGLADSFEDGKAIYPIVTESFNISGIPVKGSMFTVDQMKKGADNNPVSEDLIEMTDTTTIPNTFYLRTSPIGAYNLIPYDFVNNKYIEIVTEKDPADPKKLILKSIRLPPLEDKNKVMDQSTEKTERTLTPTPVEGAPDHYSVQASVLTAHLKDSVRGFKKLSPIEWQQVDFDPSSGWSAVGKITTGVSFLENVDISIKVENSVFTIEADIDLTALVKGKVPKPFVIDYSSLNLSASSDGAFAIGGGLGFSIENYGKGHIAGKVTNDGFGLTGGFEFDKKYFSGSLTVGYFKKGDKHDWSIEGDVTLKKNVIKNLDRLAIHLSYKEETLSGSATAYFSLPSIKSITVNASVDKDGKLTIGGSFDLGKLPKVKGATGTITVTKKGSDWDLDLDGKVTPDISFEGLKVDEVNISYHKGIFDISSGAHFKKGRIKGDFTLGLTNKPVSNDGEKSEGEGGKELKFYAQGNINVEIVEGVGGLIGVKITPAGDVQLTGRIGLTEDKHLFEMPPLDKNVFTLDQTLPLASCLVLTLELHFTGAVDIYAHLNPLTFDKGSYVELSNVSLKDFSHARITSHLSVSSHLDAGIRLKLSIALALSLLGVLKGEIGGDGTLDFRALDLGLTAIFDAYWSADEGVRLRDGKLQIKLESKLIATLGAHVRIWVNLLVTTITLWRHDWDLGSKEWPIHLFGDGAWEIPLPIGSNGQIDMTPDKMRSQLSKVEKSVNNENMGTRSRDLMDGQGTTKEDRQAEANELVKKEILDRFKNPDRFIFNRSNDYLRTRYELLDYLREKAQFEKTIDLSYIDEEIKKCEFEEYDKFGPYIQTETFPSDTKYELIDDFMTNHPTLGETEKINLRSMVVPDKKDNKGSNVQKKEMGPEPIIRRKAETDSKGAYTGNYLFDPGHGGLDTGFFNKVKKDVAGGVLADTAIKTLRADAIGRNGTVMHAELLLMAAMRNPVNVARMKAYTGGSLSIPMSDIKQADKDYLTNFGVEKNPLNPSAYMVRILASVLGVSKEKVADIVNEYDTKAMDLIRQYAGKQFSDQADRLIVFCESNPALPWDEVIRAMLNAASDSTEGDRIMAGTVYAIAKNAGHVTAPRILSGELKIDALVPSVFHRIAGDAEALYQYSTDEDVLKSDTFYIQTDLDIFRLRSQALVIHELTHAADDFAAAGPASKQEDSLNLESHAYKEQGKYMMDQILGQPAGSGPGYLNAASQYVHDNVLYYWSMVAAAKGDVAKYEATLVSINTSAPMSKTTAAVKADLGLSAADLEKKVRDALVAYRTAKGKQLYSPGTTTLGGPGGHYFVQRSPDPAGEEQVSVPPTTSGEGGERAVPPQKADGNGDGRAGGVTSSEADPGASQEQVSSEAEQPDAQTSSKIKREDAPGQPDAQQGQGSPDAAVPQAQNAASAPPASQPVAGAAASSQVPIPGQTNVVNPKGAPPVPSGPGAHSSILSTTQPGSMSPELMLVIQAIDQEQQKMADGGEQRKLLVQAAAQTQKQFARDSVDAQANRLAQVYDDNILLVQAALANARVAILSDRDTKIAEIQAHGNLQLANLHQSCDSHRNALMIVAETSATGAENAGETQAQRAITESGQKSSRALSIGESKVPQYKKYDRSARIASAIREMTSDLAGKFIEAGNELASGARKDAGDMAGKFRSEAIQSMEHFSLAETEGMSKIAGQRDDAVTGLNQLTQDPLTSLGDTANGIILQLSTQKQDAVLRVRQSSAAIEAAIDEQAALATTVIDGQTAVGNMQLTVFGLQLQKHFGAKTISPKETAELNKLVGDAGGQFSIMMDKFAGDVGQSLSDGGQAAAKNIETQVNTLTGPVQQMRLGFENNAAAVSGQVVQQIDQTAAKTQEDMDTVVTDTDKALQDSVDKSSTEWITEMTSGTAEIKQRTDTGLSKMDESLANLPSQIDQKAEDIEHESLLDRAVSWVAGIVVGFFEGLWEFVKDLLLIVLVVIAIVLIIALVILIFAGLDALLAVIVAVAVFIAASAEVIADILAVLAGLAILAGVLFGLYYIYLSITRDDLSDYERGKLAGKGIFELALALTGEKLFGKLGEYLRGLGKGEEAAKDARNLARLKELITDEQQLQRLLALFGNDSGKLERFLGIFGNDATRMETTLGLFGNDVARMEKTLGFFGEDAGRMEKALDRFGNNASDLETALGKCGNDAKLLESLLANPKIRDTKQLQSLLDDYGGPQLDDLLKSPTVPNGEQLERLSKMLKDVNFADAMTGGLQGDQLAKFATPGILDELEKAAALEKSGQVSGVRDWINFNASKSVPELNNTLGELREAERLAKQNPGSVVEIGKEANAPKNPAKPGETAPEFDVAVKDPSGKVSQSVEFTTVESKVRQAPDMTNGVRHAADKVAQRAAMGIPIPGTVEGTIQITLDVGTSPRGGVIVDIQADGNVSLIRPTDGKVLRTNNIFDDFAANLPKIANNERLDIINLVDANGNLIASFKRTGTGWARTF